MSLDCSRNDRRAARDWAAICVGSTRKHLLHGCVLEVLVRSGLLPIGVRQQSHTQSGYRGYHLLTEYQ